jgi:hypothetical protein
LKDGRKSHESKGDSEKGARGRKGVHDH